MRPNAVRAFSLQTALEWKLLARMRWPLLLPLAAFAYVAFSLAALPEGGSQDLYLQLLKLLSFFHTLSLGLPVLLGVLLARRDILHPAYEWLQAMPVSNPVFLLSKTAAGMLYSGLIPVATAAAFIAVSLRQGLSLMDALAAVLPILLYMLGSFAISLVLGLTIGVLLPARYALPIGFCGWMFGSVFIQVFMVERYGWYPLKAFYLNPMLNTDLLRNEGWAGALNSEEAAKLAPFVLSFAVFLLAWCNAALGRQRPEGSGKRAVIAVFAALLLAGAAYIPYVRMWTSRFDRIEAIASISPDQSRWMVPNERYAFRVNAVRLDVTKRDDQTLDIEAAIAFPVKQGKPLSVMDDGYAPAREPGMLTFLLHPSLRVTGFEINGKSAPYSRNGDRLSVPLGVLADSEGEQTARFRYEGKLNIPAARETYSSFVRKGGAYLPAHIGWYPLPGGDSLFFRSGREVLERRDAAVGLTADFDVRIRGFGDMPLFATLAGAPDDGSNGIRHFKQRNAAAFTLFGGRYIEAGIPDESVSVVTTAGARKESEAFLYELRARKQYYESWLGQPLDRLRQLYYFPDEPINTNRSYAPERLMGDAMLYAQATYANLDANRLMTTLQVLLFGDPDDASFAEHTEGPRSIVQEIREAILGLYDLENAGAAGQWRHSRLTHATSPEDGQMQEKINNMIIEAFESGRTEQAKQTLAFFYRQGLRIEQKPYREMYMADESQLYSYPVISYEDWLEVWNRYGPKAGEEAQGND